MKKLVIVLIVFVLALCVRGQVQQIVSSQSGARLERQEDLHWQPLAAHVSSNSIAVNASNRFQQIDGFGGSFLRSGALILSKLNASVRESVMQSLFNVTDGAGFTVGKVPIAATDFSPLGFNAPMNSIWWSYQRCKECEFTLGPDLDARGGTVHYVRRATEIAGAPIRLQSTLDYPPHWMLNVSTPLPQATVNRSEFDALARYYLRFAQHFEARSGTPIEFLSLFNEPHDSYTWITLGDIATLLVDHVAPLFAATSGAPKLTWSTEADRRTALVRGERIMRMRGVEAATDILFYHGYDCVWQCEPVAGDSVALNTTCPQLREGEAAVRQLHESFPQFKLWQSEVCYAFEFANYRSPPCPVLPRADFVDSLQWGRMLMSDMRYASAFLYWNMVLDSDGGPYLLSPEHNDPIDNIQQPLIIVDIGTQQIVYTGAYYAMAHFGRHVRPGSHRIDAAHASNVDINLWSLAFRDANTNRTVVELMNDSSRTLQVDIVDVEHNRFVTATLEPISFTTLLY
jgi:glucosylceramidase